jgi:general secretion pathway protein N
MKTLPFNPLLLIPCAVLATLMALLLTGTGSDPQWLPPGDAPPMSNANTRPLAMPELAEQRLALIWQQPLFSPTRQGDVERSKGADTGLAGYALSGVVLDGAAQWALLRQGPRALKLKLGQALDNGWVLSQLSARQATFSYQGQTRQLSIPVLRLPPPEAADDAPRLPAPSVVHTDAPQEAEPPVTAP